MSKPYKEIQINENKKLRFFHANVINESELEWHRDRDHRLVEVLEANGWKFQYDNELPIDLQEGDKLFIPKEHYHRIIKGNGDLVVEITENPSEDLLKEAKGSTKGYIYEVTVSMVTDRSRNKSEIVNDLRSIKDVTVVSIIPGQNFALQRTKTKERTLIKIKFAPGSSPLKKMQLIKQSAFGRTGKAACPHPKIEGLVSLDFKRQTLKPIRTY
jgi:mannose-6-phosphate isomerase class I